MFVSKHTLTRNSWIFGVLSIVYIGLFKSTDLYRELSECNISKEIIQIIILCMLFFYLRASLALECPNTRYFLFNFFLQMMTVPNTATVTPATITRTVTIAAIVEAGSLSDDTTVNTHVNTHIDKQIVCRDQFSVRVQSKL